MLEHASHASALYVRRPRMHTTESRMRTHLLAAALITLALFGNAWGTPTISFRSRELQEGRNFIRTHMTVPQVAQASGQISYGYKIEIPAGRGITPKVELQYASRARQSE